MKKRSKDVNSQDLKFDKILLMICDQFRFPAHWGELMEEGGSLAEKYFPTYARLKKNGIEFKNAYIASSACNASRACIYTGKYGRETGVTSTSGFGNETSADGHFPKVANHVSWVGLHPYDPKCSLPNDDVIKTIGTHFRLNGYRAIYKGKWHLSEVEGGWPNKAYDAEGLAKFGFEGWNPPEGHGGTPVRWGMGADVSYVQDAVNSLYELKDTNHKWFMALNLINPHDVGFFEDWPIEIPEYPGLEVPESFLTPQELLDQKPLAQSIARWYWNSVTFRRYREMTEGAGEEIIGEDEWKKYCNYYAHLAQIADFNMGIVLDTLEATGQLDDTLVVYLSDHGEMGGAHGQTQKWYQAYQETIHVPLVFSNKRLANVTTDDEGNEVVEGNTTDSFASLIDIAPTLLSLAGINPTLTRDVQNLHDSNVRDELRGVDLTPILQNPADSVQDAVLFVTDDDSVFSVVGGMIKKAKLKQYIPNGSKWKGMRSSEIEFVERMRKELENGAIPGESIETLQAVPRFVRAIVTKIGGVQWKLVVYTDNQDKNEDDLQKGINENSYACEMYDLTNDSKEKTNLFNGKLDDSNRVIFTKLLAIMMKLLAQKYYKPNLRVSNDNSAS